MRHEFKSLISSFDLIPRPTPNPLTFLEISGIPHYENVNSNILSFLIDTEQKHGFGDLFIKSLLRSYNIESNRDEIHIQDQELKTKNVDREVKTDSNKRIDILIETEDFAIAIENKIGANLYNDLEDYSKHMDIYHSDSKNIIKIVLSINREPVELLTHNFVNITHKQLFKIIKMQIADKLPLRNRRYLNYLMDFIETMENQTKPNPINSNMLKFFIQNEETLQEIVDEKNRIKEQIYYKIKRIKNSISTSNLSNVNQWVWEKYNLVHDFTFENGIEVTVDCYFEFDGIWINLWVRKGDENASGEFLKKLEIYSDKLEITDGKIKLQEKEKMPLNTDESVVVKSLIGILSKIKKKHSSQQAI